MAGGKISGDNILVNRNSYTDSRPDINNNVYKRKLAVYLPGRLESERLPNKLILPMGESCLWDIACEKLNRLHSYGIDAYVLCHHEELISIARKYPYVKIIKRDIETTKVDGPLTYIFKDLDKIDEEVTHFMFLNPCLPLLSLETIVGAGLEFIESNYSYGSSVKIYKNWLWESDGIECLTSIDFERLTTKEIPDHYEAAHCFHIFDRKKFFENGKMLDEGFKKLPVPKEETIDVDDYTDYQYAKFRMSERYCIDIDKTICFTEDMDYANATPIKDRIDKINKLYDAGNYIILDTARGSGTGIDYYKLTVDQLTEWGVKYHELHVGKKIPADKYIDDKGVNADEFFR